VAYEFASIYNVRAIRVSQYGRYNFFVWGPKFITLPGKDCEDIPSSPEVIGAYTLILGQNLNFCNYFFWGGRWVDPVLVGVYVNKTWSISNACENFKGQQPLRAEM